MYRLDPSLLATIRCALCRSIWLRFGHCQTPTIAWRHSRPAADTVAISNRTVYGDACVLRRQQNTPPIPCVTHTERCSHVMAKTVAVAGTGTLMRLGGDFTEWLLQREYSFTAVAYNDSRGRAIFHKLIFCSDFTVLLPIRNWTAWLGTNNAR